MSGICWELEWPSARAAAGCANLRRRARRALSPRHEFPVATRLHGVPRGLHPDTSPGDSGFNYRSISCSRYPTRQSATKKGPQEMNIVAMVLAGGEGTRLHPLTAEHAKPAVPF